MKFAKYWQKVDVSVDEKLFGRDHVQVWGASNDNDQMALTSAQTRAGQLSNFFDKGFDRNEEYEYGSGYIREEVIDRVLAEDGTELAVITRNSYGALVLNTETVLFGDIDLPEAGLVDKILELFGRQKKDKTYYLKQIETYQKEQSQLSIYVYETFAGLRFVVVNAVYAPGDEFIKTIFKALNVDPLYIKLCKHQACFRARLTAKPWRVGMERPASRFPRANAADISEFKSWLKRYKAACESTSAVKLVKKLGVHHMHPDVVKVLDIHDYYACKTLAELA